MFVHKYDAIEMVGDVEIVWWARKIYHNHACLFGFRGIGSASLWKRK